MLKSIRRGEVRVAIVEGFLEGEDLSWALNMRQRVRARGRCCASLWHPGRPSCLKQKLLLEIGGGIWMHWGLGTGCRSGYRRTLLGENQTGVREAKFCATSSV